MSEWKRNLDSDSEMAARWATDTKEDFDLNARIMAQTAKHALPQYIARVRSLEALLSEEKKANDLCEKENDRLFAQIAEVVDNHNLDRSRLKVLSAENEELRNRIWALHNHLLEIQSSLDRLISDTPWPKL